MVLLANIAAFAVLVVGLFLVSLAMDRHRRQLSLSPAVRPWLLRAIGCGCIGAGVSLFVAVNGTAGFGLVLGMLAAGVGILLVALAFAWRY